MPAVPGVHRGSRRAGARSGPPAAGTKRARAGRDKAGTLPGPPRGSARPAPARPRPPGGSEGARRERGARFGSARIGSCRHVGSEEVHEAAQQAGHGGRAAAERVGGGAQLLRPGERGQRPAGAAPRPRSALGGSGRSPAALGAGRAGQGMRGEEEEEGLEQGQSWVGVWQRGGCAGRGGAGFGMRRARLGKAGDADLSLGSAPCVPYHPIPSHLRRRAPLSSPGREHHREAALGPGVGRRQQEELTGTGVRGTERTGGGVPGCGQCEPGTWIGQD